MGATVPAAVSGRAPQEPVASESSWLKIATVDVTMSSSYATGGDTLDFTTIGLIGNRGIVHVMAAPSAGYTPEFDRTNRKMKVYQQSAATGALTEPTATTNLSAVTFRCLVYHM